MSFPCDDEGEKDLLGYSFQLQSSQCDIEMTWHWEGHAAIRISGAD